MKKDITLFGLLVLFYILVVTLLFINKPKEIGIENMAGHLDKALLQMAGFEDEGDLYAKAGTPFFSRGILGMGARFDPSTYQGLTGKAFQYGKDRDDDAAQIKTDEARLNALLYAWSKDNPDEQITPELIDRMKFFAATANSMKDSGGYLWNNGTASKDENVKAFIKLMQKHPEKANSVLGKNYNKYNSPVQNYFDWAGQYMDEDTTSSNWGNLTRNLYGGAFSDNVSIASRNLGDKLMSSVNTPTPEEIARSNIMKDLKNIIKEKATEERRRRAWSNAGLGSLEDEEDDSIYPDEWL